VKRDDFGQAIATDPLHQNRRATFSAPLATTSCLVPRRRDAASAAVKTTELVQNQMLLFYGMIASFEARA
jgi:hypothetical protein